MERLSFETNGDYSGVEATIHIARYALARNLCQGKKVLDIACGEGFGSRLLLEWGAAEVVGVDVSEDAVASARKLFAKPGIRYLCGDAENIDQIIVDEKFDLIVSFETIEHLKRPDAFLSAIARLSLQKACVLITCPNDWWYYHKEGEGNIYHMRKYTYDEFLGLVTAGLGAPNAVGVGTPSLGFANFALSRVRNLTEESLQVDMMNCVDHVGLLALPPVPGSVSVKNSSYFVAAWGITQDRLMGAAMFPISMDVLSAGIWQSSLTSQNSSVMRDELQLKLLSAESKLESALQEIAKLTNASDASLMSKSEIDNMSEQFEEQRLLALKYRNQANALLLETAILQQALAEKKQVVSEHEDSLKALLKRVVSKLKNSLKALLKRVVSKFKDSLKAFLKRVINKFENYLRALLNRWTFITAVLRKILPARFVAEVKNIVRRLR